ncbi:MAG: methanogenesis marker 3 protein [Methanolinea sp.]|nr:methanogenesis marker 3 protein [Methanolinea sp.]
MIAILLDGDRLEIDQGTRLRDVIPGRDPACCVAIVRPGTRESTETKSYRLTTTMGEVVVELTEQGRQAFLSQNLAMPLALHWHDRYAAAFGPFSTQIVPARTTHLYENGDLVLGCGGYDPKHSYLIFSRSRHSSDFGAEAAGGVIGRVVSGRGVIDRWGTGDRITALAPVISWADTSRSFTTRDDDLVLEDGMEIVTFLGITASGYPGKLFSETTSRSVEHMLLALQDGHFVVGRSASTYIRDERREETDVPAAENLPRREGSVTLRTRGRSRGSLYIYLEDLPKTSSHTTIGQVTHGLEIPRLAKEGDILCIRLEPRQFDLVGLPLDTAIKTAASRNIETVVDTAGPDRVVIEQTPETTLESLAAGKVSLATIALEKVIDIVLDDKNAPGSCDIFRRLTGLHLHDVGRMPFFFTFEDVYLFKPKIPLGVKIIPENTPQDIVPAATLAITNDSRRGSGLVGVRLSDNREFGPTSEPFEGTNLIGSVLDFEKLKQMKEKEIVFVREIRE